MSSQLGIDSEADLFLLRPQSMAQSCRLPVATSGRGGGTTLLGGGAELGVVARSRGSGRS